MEFETIEMPRAREKKAKIIQRVLPNLITVSRLKQRITILMQND
jgi:hypothetical protein